MKHHPEDGLLDGKSLLVMGMKHSGKSTLARMLAWDMKVTFIDLDELVEKEYRSDRMLSCREIYAQHGKEFFMDLEHSAALRLGEQIQSHFLVAALGGGTIENNSALAAIEADGVFVYLRVEAGVLFRRISKSGIPPFLSKDRPFEDFLELFEKRTSLLEGRADISVDLPEAEIQESFLRLSNKIKEYGYAW